MRHELAEKKIRALQKGFLTRIEQHAAFHILPPDLFNLIRKRVFRGTFEAYRLGIVGFVPTESPPNLYAYFFGWTDDAAAHLPPLMHKQIVDMCFGTALEAYRIGAMVAASRFVEA